MCISVIILDLHGFKNKKEPLLVKWLHGRVSQLLYESRIVSFSSLINIAVNICLIYFDCNL